MNFDDLKERIREFFQSVTGRVRESSAWNQLTEKYADLSPQGQKIALIGGSAGATLLLMLIPSCVFLSSSSNIDEFESHKQLMRDLYRVNREAISLPPPPATLSSTDLRNRVQGELATAGLQPDQLGGVSDFDNKAKSSPWIPKSLEQSGVTVNVKKLNLTQIVEIGQRLQGLAPTAKMIGLEVHAQREDPHYFDVAYRIVAFNFPQAPLGKDKGPKKTPGAKGKE